jgi:AraC-like DNA-binding protein
LLRELILRAAEFPLLYAERSTQGRVMALILDEIRTFRALPLHLPMPDHPRLASLCNQIREDPGSARTLDEWARHSGSSIRNLARQFATHTGMSFRVWRQQARLHSALGRLAAGAPVTRVALELGYTSPSAFTSMFRKALGATPRDYFTTERANTESSERGTRRLER